MRTSYITPTTEYTPCGIYDFAKTVFLQQKEKYRICIYTTGRYILRINGQYICEGPCKGHEAVRYYDTVETDAFAAGENRISITVLHMNDGRRFTTVFQKPKPEVIFEAVSETKRIVSDASWDCRLDQRYELVAYQWRFLPPFEYVDFCKGSQVLSLMESGGFDFDAGIITDCGIADGQLLQPRPIPMIWPGDEIALRVVKGGDGYVDLDAGKYVTAKVEFDFAANVSARIIYAECYEGENGKELRDDTSGNIEGYYDRVNTGDTEATFAPFWFRAFRYIRIETENPESALKAARARLCHYPFQMEGSFLCSDPYYNEMYTISVNTMRCCTHETFVDCPYYEQQQYTMDSAIECMVMLRMTSDTRMVKKCIGEFAASQRADGMLLANYPSIYQQVIPGFAFFWVIMLRDYLEMTADIAFVRQYVGTMEKVFSWFESGLSEDGLIRNSVYWNFVDWVPGWDNGQPLVAENAPHTIYNLYYAHALLCAEDICGKLGRTGLAMEYRQRYDRLAANIKDHCYDDARGLYTDGGKDSGYSMHTIIWAILAELETGEKAIGLLNRLHDGNLSKSSFSMNYYLFRAMEKCGKAERIFDNLAGWKKMIDLHCTTWCENPDDPRSECHAWSSAPLYVFSADTLGVKIGFDDEIVIQPTVAGLSWAKGTVPTRFGIVKVDWKMEKEQFCIRISAPAGIRKRVILPDGEMIVFTDAEFRK